MGAIKNPILKALQGLIGIAPVPGPVVLDDDSISLTLPVVPHIARRSLAGIELGWFVGLMENVHSGADSEASSIDPYEPGALLAVPPYPPSVPDDFDLWLLGISGTRSSGTGGLTGALFTLNPNDTSQGWGIDDAGVALLGTPSIRLGLFDSISELVQAFTTDPMINSLTLQTFYKLGIRVPRGAILSFETEAAAAAEFQGQFLLGLFPAGLGQDVAT